MTDFEVIVVDQNEHDLLKPVLDEGLWPFPVRHIRTPGERGISRGRNHGWPRAQGDTILFPDDDCWYPPDLMERGVALMDRLSANILGGRAIDQDGRPINGRYASRATAITRDNAFITQIEWMVFFRKSALEKLGGYDEDIGVGSGTPWQSCEGPDIVLRALDLGLRPYFDPSIGGHHNELDIVTPDEAMQRKGRAYGRGLGFVLRKHGFSPFHAGYWTSRAALNAARSLLRADMNQGRYYANVAMGRLEGYLQTSF